MSRRSRRHGNRGAETLKATKEAASIVHSHCSIESKIAGRDGRCTFRYRESVVSITGMCKSAGIGRIQHRLQQKLRSVAGLNATYKAGTSRRSPFSCSSPRNFLLSGGARAQETLRANTLASANSSAIQVSHPSENVIWQVYTVVLVQRRSPRLQDLKAANESLAVELTRQRNRHDKEVSELKQELARAQHERDAQHAQNVRSYSCITVIRCLRLYSIQSPCLQEQKREEKMQELAEKQAANTKVSQHLVDLQKQ